MKMSFVYRFLILISAVFLAACNGQEGGGDPMFSDLPSISPDDLGDNFIVDPSAGASVAESVEEEYVYNANTGECLNGEGDVGYNPGAEPKPCRNLEGQEFTQQDLSGIDLRGSNLQNTKFKDVNLEGVQLDGALLNGAQLDEVNLVKASLRDAELNETKIKSSNLSDEKVAEALTVENVQVESSQLPPQFSIFEGVVRNDLDSNELRDLKAKLAEVNALMKEKRQMIRAANANLADYFAVIRPLAKEKSLLRKQIRPQINEIKEFKKQMKPFNTQISAINKQRKDLKLQIREQHKLLVAESDEVRKEAIRQVKKSLRDTRQALAEDIKVIVDQRKPTEDALAQKRAEISPETDRIAEINQRIKEERSYWPNELAERREQIQGMRELRKLKRALVAEIKASRQ